MRKLIMSLCIIALISTASYALEENRAYFPPVLMYHELNMPPRNTFDTTPEAFASQLDWLKDNDYETLSLEEFISYVKKGEGFPEKSVLITFDDGYAGLPDRVIPELKKRNMKAAVFIIIDRLGETEDRYPYLTVSQLLEVAKEENISIGAHTISHPDLNELSKDAMMIEIARSKRILENFTGRKIQAFAYPSGNYNGAVIDAVKEAGYEVAFAVDDKGLFGHEARFSIPRIYTGLELSENDNRLFKEFVKNYKDMPVDAFKERWKPIGEK
jgi:peptidoglycan/xylan/chitin deacetylase (PgdA/CDA1 family)